MKKNSTPTQLVIHQEGLSPLEVQFACAFLPVVYGSTKPDTGVDADNIRWAIRLGKLAARIASNED